jgi:hypothetical protein
MWSGDVMARQLRTCKSRSIFVARNTGSPHSVRRESQILEGSDES